MRPSATTLESELTYEELECLLELLRSSQYTGRHLEIGTAAGGTLWQMMRCYDQENCPEFVVVDPMQYFPRQLEIVQNNLTCHGASLECVDFRVMTSDAAFAKAQKRGESFDFIFVDGAHKVRYVMEDLRWSSLLNPGGLLVLHDFSPKYRGVWFAVNRFLRKNQHFSIVNQVHKLIVLKKEKAVDRPEISSWDLLLAKFLAPCFQMEASIKKRI
jgi:predicted O-methyltransferase YrrM